MGIYLLPLLLGFIFNLASAFTATFSRRWGEQRGSLATFILRNILGIPVWALGYALAFGTPSPWLWPPRPLIIVLGWIFLAGGGLIIGAALLAIRARAAKPSARDSLVQEGLYARVRHPIHSGMFLELVGLFLLRPTRAVTLACAVGIVWVFIQTRFEEFDLLQRLPDYRPYMARVPRFLPRLRAR
jgi:protein-S-isoprenylcysteine O-methyltransferase Ste14